MKNILFAVLGIFLMTAILSSCKDNSTNTAILPTAPPPPPATPANPKIVFGNLGFTAPINVMDTDGSHVTTVYTTAANSELVGMPNWSTGTSIVWSENINDATGNWNYIKAADITVNANGTPVANNIRTLATSVYRNGAASDSVAFKHPAWSSTAGVDRIAYGIYPGVVAPTHPLYLCTMNSSGASVDTLHAWSYGTGIINLCWNADDSKIAVVLSSNGSERIAIIDAATGAETDSVTLSGGNEVNSLEIDWSRTSGTVNKLAYQGVDGFIYYVSPTTGSVPATNSVASNSTPTWSPNNSSLIYQTSTTSGKKTTQYLKKVVEQSSTISTVVTGFGYSASGMNWHR